MRRILFIIPIVLFFAVVAYFFVAMRGGYDPSVLPSAMVGKPVPAFDLPGPPSPPNYAGPPVKLGFSNRDMLGRVVVVNFFASWCVPCIEEAEVLMGLKQSGVPLYGIAYKDKPAATAQFLADHGDPYARLAEDELGRVAIDWGVTGVPETYLIDKTGFVRWRCVGPMTPDTVADELQPLLRHYA